MPGDGKKRLFARPPALLVDSNPSRITLPAPPPITMRPPDPVAEPEEEPAAGPVKLFVGRPRVVSPLSVRAGLDRAPFDSDIDENSAGPGTPLPFSATPLDQEPPSVPTRWGRGAARDAAPYNPPISQARASTGRPDGAASPSDAAQTPAAKTPPPSAKTPVPAPEDPKRPRAALDAQPVPAPVPQPAARAAAPTVARVDRPLQPAASAMPPKGQRPFVPKLPPTAKPGVHPGIWAALGVFFLSIGIAGTWFEIRDSVLRAAPVQVVAEPPRLVTPVVENPPPTVETLPEPVENPPEPIAPPVAAVAPPPEPEPPVVPEPVAETPVNPPQSAAPPAPDPAPPIETAPKPKANPMDKQPLIERAVILADRPSSAKSAANAEKPPDAAPGMLRITTSVAAKLYVDGKAHGQIAKDMLVELPAGFHDVRLVAQKTGRSQTQRVRVDSGVATMLAYDFK